MVKSKSKPVGNTAFFSITEKIESEQRKSSRPRITKLKTKQADILFYANATDADLISRDDLSGLESLSLVPGNARPVATMTIGFDSRENLQNFLDKKFSPETGAWKRIAQIASNAKSDPWVIGSQTAVSFLGMIQAIADRAVGGYSAEEVLAPLSDFLKSEQAKRNAQSKNEAPRAWVLSEWLNRPDQGQKKAPFARQYSPLVKKQFGLIVNPDTIARDWLPKAKK